MRPAPPPPLTPAVAILIGAPVLFLVGLALNAMLPDGAHVPVALALASVGLAATIWAALRGQRRMQAGEGVGVGGAVVLSVGALEAVGFASFAFAAVTAMVR